MVPDKVVMDHDPNIFHNKLRFLNNFSLKININRV
jgi:hypothetical protein